jgi:hypothetical protein
VARKVGRDQRYRLVAFVQPQHLPKSYNKGTTSTTTIAAKAEAKAPAHATTTTSSSASAVGAEASVRAAGGVGLDYEPCQEVFAIDYLNRDVS